MPRLGEKLQRRSFEDPKMNPQPLATWQVSVPTFTPAACAGAAKATAPEISAALNAVNPNLFDIVSFSFMVSGCSAGHFGFARALPNGRFCTKARGAGTRTCGPGSGFLLAWARCLLIEPGEGRTVAALQGRNAGTKRVGMGAIV